MVLLKKLKWKLKTTCFDQIFCTKFMTNFRFIYTGIRVRNIQESLEFYTKVLEMEIVDKLEHAEPTKGQAVVLKSPDSNQLLELNSYEEGSQFGSEYKNGEELDHLAFDVDDLVNTVEELRRKGIEIVAEPFSIGSSIGWREAFVKDPNGIWIELLERKKTNVKKSDQ
jgi:lactoylglutathione lyase